MRSFIGSIVLLGILLALGAGSAHAATYVTCTNPGDLQTAVNAAAPFTTIYVSGTCTEPGLYIGPDKNGLVLDGQATAIIQNVASPPAGATAVSVAGASEVQIRNFANITSNTTDGTGIYLTDAASARIYNNTISGNQDGMDIKLSSVARIYSNTISGNSDVGILVTETASARIGVNSISFETQTVLPNTIQGNGTGIKVWRGSSARIFGNTIANNTNAGVDIRSASAADLASNALTGNQDGIYLSRNSSVLLGQDTGTGPLNDPNTGTNWRYGINCATNSSVDGRLGPLSGSKAAKHFDTSSVNSLLP